MRKSGETALIDIAKEAARRLNPIDMRTAFCRSFMLLLNHRVCESERFTRERIEAIGTVRHSIHTTIRCRALTVCLF